jgi:hypothetical protein
MGRHSRDGRSHSPLTVDARGVSGHGGAGSMVMMGRKVCGDRQMRKRNILDIRAIWRSAPPTELRSPFHLPSQAAVSRSTQRENRDG